MISESIGSLLHQCSKSRAFRDGLCLHAAVFKTGTKNDVVVSNHILNMYAKCGIISSARRVFDEMPERNLVSWSAMIAGYDQGGKSRMAIHLFSQMRLLPNEYIFSSVISACGRLLALVPGQQVHAEALKLGFASISFVCHSLISMYMKCSCCNDALSIFTSIAEPCAVSFNSIISGLLEIQQPEGGFEIYKLMHRQGFVPDRFTFVGVLGICMSTDDMRRGMSLHCQAVKLKLDCTQFVGNVIITMYSRFMLIDDAEMAFRLIEEKDVVSWNTLIAACSHCDDHTKSLRVFEEMTKELNVVPDYFTFSGALAACASIASIYHGRQIHAHLIRTRLIEDVGVGNALVNMYAKCGCIRNAYAIFDQMGCHNIVSWNSIIVASGNHGFAEKAFQLFKQMKELGVKPDSVTFVGLLTACNHAGLVEKGKDYFNSMKVIYGIAPDIEHFSCLIDLLSRAGRLHEAVEYLAKFPFGKDPIVLGSLLSACRLHGYVVIGEQLAKRLLKLKPSTTSPYVLLANLYSMDKMWGDVAEARKMLHVSGLKKDPGYSLVEVKGTVHRFRIGHFSHPRTAEINGILKTLKWEAEEQFFPSVSENLFDEKGLCGLQEHQQQIYD